MKSQSQNNSMPFADAPPSYDNSTGLVPGPSTQIPNAGAGRGELNKAAAVSYHIHSLSSSIYLCP